MRMFSQWEIRRKHCECWILHQKALWVITHTLNYTPHYGISYSSSLELLSPFCFYLLVIRIFFYLLLDQPHYSVKELIPFLPVFRAVLDILLTFFGASLCFWIFSKYKVNYVILMELDTKSPMSYRKVLKFALIFSIIWETLFIFQILQIKYDIISNKVEYFAFVLVTVFLIALFWPFGKQQRTFKMEILKTLFEVIISPFGKIRFRHIIMGDTLTSLPKTFYDFALTFACLYQGGWLNSEPPSGSFLSRIEIICLFLPFMFKFWQCIRKYLDYHHKTYLIDSLKYVSYLIYITINSYKKLSSGFTHIYTIGLIWHLVVVVYAYLWDVIQDWGLLRRKSRNYLLRDNLLYPKKFYYFAMVTNLVLRLGWATLLLPQSYIVEGFFDGHLIIFLLIAMEVLRRTLWAVIRVENDAGTNLPRLPVSFRAISWCAF